MFESLKDCPPVSLFHRSSEVIKHTRNVMSNKTKSRRHNEVEETQSLSGQQGAGAVQQQRDVPPLFHESSLGFNE